MTNSLVRVAAVQLASGADPGVNIERAISLIASAVDQGATYVQLPEYFNYRGPTSRYGDIHEEIPGPTTARLSEVAKAKNITLHLGSMFERSPDPAKR